VGNGADADRDSLARGTTTVLDGGSTGANSFAGLKRYVIEQAKSRVLAWLNISTVGLIDIRVGELMNLLWVDVEAAVRTAEANRECIIGFKGRLSTYVAGGSCKPALKLLREAAEATRLPFMVHIGDTMEPLPEILDFLRPGDVVTHSLTGRRHGILDYSGNVWPAVREARQAGAHFDAAHGRSHFGFAAARGALEQGFLVDTLATDLTTNTAADPEFHLPLLMSKLMALGASLDEVVLLVTSNPARYLKLDGEIGTLQPGACADVAVLELVEGDFALHDNEGQAIQAKQRLEPWLTVRAGKIAASPSSQEALARG
jgi:dihydroorotase